MTRKITTILLALALCLTLLPVGAGAATTQKPWETGSGWQALTSNNSNTPLCDGREVTYADEPIGPLDNKTSEPETRDCYILDGGTYYLSEDVTIDKSLLIKGDTILDLNGHVLKLCSSIYDGSATGSVIVVNGGIDFTLTDSNPTAPHKLKLKTVTIRHAAEGNTLGEVPFFTPENGIYVVDDTDGTIPITGGIITGGLLHYNTSGGKYGGGVWVRGGFDDSINPQGTTFTMQGGNIVGCAADNGGGVYATRATFAMEGGCIKGCAAESFGGVGGSGGNFTMKGGTIEDCTANRGGAVGFNDSNTCSSFTMQGGTISGCKTVKSTSGDVDLTSVQMTANGGKVCGTVYIMGDKSGIISTGSSSTTAFHGKVTNIGYTITTTNTGTISGGVFYGEVENAGGSITGGVFYGRVTNCGQDHLTVSGAKTDSGKITGGVFYGGVVNEDGNPVTFEKTRTATFNWNYDDANEPYKAATVVGEKTQLVAPVDPTRDDYHFAGWYKTAGCTDDAVLFPCSFDSGATFYASWHALSEWQSDSSQHWRSCTVSGCNVTPDKENHTFNGRTCTVCGYTKPHYTRINTPTEPIESPKTADIGVALYAVMALTSCTGTALVVRGRKRK